VSSLRQSLPGCFYQCLEPAGGFVQAKAGAGAEGAEEAGTLMFPELLLGAVEEAQHVVALAGALQLHAQAGVSHQHLLCGAQLQVEDVPLGGLQGHEQAVDNIILRGTPAF